MRNIVQMMNKNESIIYSSVITLTKVLIKPVKENRKDLVQIFTGFLKNPENIYLLGISSEIAEKAGELRGKNSFLKTMDAIQLAVALNIGAEVFLTNDSRLKKFKELKVLTLNEFDSSNKN